MDNDPVLTALQEALKGLEHRRDMLPFKSEDGRRMAVAINWMEMLIAYYQQYIAG
jgi:hypothetical protein